VRHDRIDRHCDKNAVEKKRRDPVGDPARRIRVVCTSTSETRAVMPMTKLK
jgi:hypothetical protein